MFRCIVQSISRVTLGHKGLRVRFRKHVVGNGVVSVIDDYFQEVGNVGAFDFFDDSLQ